MNLHSEDDRRAMAYPLAWPERVRRTSRPKRSTFRITFARARDDLLAEIRRLGGRYAVISTNMALRRDGLPYANLAQPADTGVAVYFLYRDKQHCFACDRWDRVHDNVHAINKTIAAIRGIERWGSSDMLERAFAAFEALPPAATDWRTVLGLGHYATYEDAKAAYHARARQAHPDVGGRPDDMAKLNAAWANAKRELGAT